MSKTRAPLLAAALAWALAASGCKEPSPCVSICKRVARCKKQARDGEPMLGEGEDAPDARCLARCQDKPSEFSKCEAKQRTCAELRGCYGPLQ